MNDLTHATPIGCELGTSASKFCCDDTLVIFSSVVGDSLTEKMEESWRLMNRSKDSRWARNLAIFDDSRNSWRYVGAMTRNSERVNWFTDQGLIRDHEDAFLATKAGLFLLAQEMETQNKPIKQICIGFGITVRHGENVIENFFSFMKDKLIVREGKKFLTIKAKNVALNQIKEIEVELVFSVMQYQAYGAYMSLLFSKYNMNIYNTYIVDIGHGTWIKLPIIENEAEINLSDSFTEGVHTITKNISKVIFESSAQKFKIPEQRIMERLPSKDYKLEVPGVGVYDFTKYLQHESQLMARSIVQRISNDMSLLSQKGHTVDYFLIIGGGAHLLTETIRSEIGKFFEWPEEVLTQKIIDANTLGVDPRYINCVGLMLLARDQIALEMNQEVDPVYCIKTIIQDTAQ
ncbi:MAG: hypothetical protein HQK50_09670 [Oligoflexia bacterium]|nr:hypothetical protein [Oligoflexia bacterium]MBF0365830.1 hypothetical protein [Oligoflexia bacterium]